MSKFIFVFIDGTGNKPGQIDEDEDGQEVVVESNVLKLWKALTANNTVYTPGDLAGDDLLKYYGVVQNVVIGGKCLGEAVYFNGVGVQGGAVQEKLEGGLGTGTSVRIRDAYRFVAEQFDPDDKICLFGFSRGAYAARSLAGFIDHVGLPSTRRIVSEHELSRMYTSYREGKKYYGALRQFLQPADIEFLGAWDTVGSLALHDTLNDFHMISPGNVRHMRHALALDEGRPHFKPSYWKSKTKKSLVECWFTGAHSNIGGGYRNPGLSNIAYIWMLREFDRELKLGIDVMQDSVYSADEASENVMTEVRDSFREFYQSFMKFTLRLKSWKGKPEYRKIKEGQLIHPSVFECMCKVAEANTYVPMARFENQPISLNLIHQRLAKAEDWPLEDELFKHLQ